MLAPRRAPPRAGALLDFPVEGWLNPTTEDGAAEGEAAGGSAAACCLDHIENLPYRNSGKKICSAQGSSVESMLCRAARRGNRETKRICAVGKLTGGTGRKRQARPERQAPDFPLTNAKTKSGV